MYCNFFVVKANNYSDDNNNNYLFFNVGTILINVWGDIDGAILQWDDLTRYPYIQSMLNLARFISFLTHLAKGNVSF
jgi:hypothetical protein